MGANVTVVLFAVFLACLLVSSSKCEGDGMKRSSSGGHRWRHLDGGQMTAGSNKFVVQLCFYRRWCGSHWTPCYCCETLPNMPCYPEQQKCWDVCPGAPPQPHQQPQPAVLAGRQ